MSYVPVQIKLNHAYLGDCLELMKHIHDASVDLVITDPPYMVSKELSIRRGSNPQKYRFNGKDINYDFGRWDWFESKEAYFEFTRMWLQECARILKPAGHIVAFFDKWKIGQLVEMGEKYGIRGRQPLLWKKTNPVPCVRKSMFQSSYEMAYWGTKHSCYSTPTFNYRLGQHHDCLETAIPPTPKNRKRHPCEKHPDWIAWVMSYLSNEGDVVLDPFAGTGVFAKVARKLGRNFIVIEKEKEYYDVIKQRLSQQVLILPIVNLSNKWTKCPGGEKW